MNKKIIIGIFVMVLIAAGIAYGATDSEKATAAINEIRLAFAEAKGQAPEDDSTWATVGKGGVGVMGIVIVIGLIIGLRYLIKFRKSGYKTKHVDDILGAEETIAKRMKEIGEIIALGVERGGFIIGELRKAGTGGVPSTPVKQADVEWGDIKVKTNNNGVFSIYVTPTKFGTADLRVTHTYAGTDGGGVLYKTTKTNVKIGLGDDRLKHIFHTYP